MPVMVNVPGHGTVPKFRDEREMQAYDAQQVKSGKSTFPTGVKFGVERTVTAVLQSGKAVLKTNVATGGASAPLTAYGAYTVGGTPFIGDKPVMSEMTFASPGTYYGVIGITTLIAIIVVAIILAFIIAQIVAMLTKMMEQKDPEERKYTDKDGCNHTVYTGGGGFLGYTGITDLDECTGAIQNQGGYTPFLTTPTGTDIGSQLSRSVIPILGIALVAGIGYVVYKKYGPQIKAKVAPAVAKGKAVVAKGKAVAGAVKKEIKEEPKKEPEEPKKEGA